MSRAIGFPKMEELNEFPPMNDYTSKKYGGILNQGICIKQNDGEMSIGLIHETFGIYNKYVRKIYLMSNTEALIDFVHYKEERLQDKFFNILNRVVQMSVNGVQPPLFVTCSPISQAQPPVVHDFIFMLCEGLSPLGLVMACDIIIIIIIFLAALK